MWSAPLLLTLSGLSAAAFGPTIRPRGLRPASTTVVRSAQVACSVPESPDAALDELIRREVESAFAELDASDGLTEEEEGELDALIEAKGDMVLRNVLNKLESDGDQLAATLQRQVASYTKERQVEMLRKFDEDAAKVQREMAADREAMRAEVNKLSSLQSEYGLSLPRSNPPLQSRHATALTRVHSVVAGSRPFSGRPAAASVKTASWVGSLSSPAWRISARPSTRGSGSPLATTAVWSPSGSTLASRSSVLATTSTKRANRRTSDVLGCKSLNVACHVCHRVSEGVACSDFERPAKETERCRQNTDDVLAMRYTIFHHD